MRRIALLSLLLALWATSSFAQAFSPDVMSIEAPENVVYDFDGTRLNIDFDLTGAPATIVFCLFTKGKGEEIGVVQNGHLGWHYVNSIDTCVYFHPGQYFDTGNNTFQWDGMDSEDNLVPAGEYTYYLWGFDSNSNKKKACSWFGGSQGQAGFIQQYDEDNLVMDRPVYYPPPGTVTQLSVEEGGYGGASDPGTATRARWTLGGDPDNETLIETTRYLGWGTFGKIALMPGDHSNFYVWDAIQGSNLSVIRKLKWVPNGESTIDEDWAETGRYEITNSVKSLYTGPISDNIDQLWVVIADQSYPEITNPTEIHYIDYVTGEQLRAVDLSDWWIDPDEWAKWDDYGFKMHGGPSMANYSNGYIFAGGLSACYKHLIDPYQDDDEDITVWMNGNGDYVGDRFWQEDAGDKAWLCVGASGAPWIYDVTLDSNQFCSSATYGLGAVSFDLYAPDGTGIGYFAFQAETDGIKYGHIIVDNGGSYDGIYTDNQDSETEATDPGLWFVAQDTFKGTMSAVPIVVEEEGPAAFAVSQNVPNPFNPTTSIGFSIAEAGKVKVDVFNVAGQKIDTLVDENMSAGSHSVTWDAASFSAGVYFYTVQCDNYSETKKMTLLK